MNMRRPVRRLSWWGLSGAAFVPLLSGEAGMLSSGSGRARPPRSGETGIAAIVPGGEVEAPGNASGGQVFCFSGQFRRAGSKTPVKTTTGFAAFKSRCSNPRT